MTGLEVLTFGCRLNAYESEVMRERAAAAGLDGAVLVNSCAVTAEAVRQTRQAIRKARREHPAARIVVTGCAAQTAPAAFTAMPEVDAVLGNAEKLSDAAWARLASTPHRGTGSGGATEDVSDILAARRAEGLDTLAWQPGRARAYVPVQTGCDHRCTFCVIPHGRGNSRSVPAEAVVARVRRLAEAGCREVVLTGVDLTAYGLDLAGEIRLGGLVRRILREVQAIPRLRLSSIDSVEADADLIAALGEEERLMPHLHLSLQAGDDMILKRMKRRHSRADAVAFCAAVRRVRPDVTFGADLIAGFPTEAEAMFANSLALVEDCGLTFLHVFPFSPREGTPAARMPQVAREVVKARAARLRAAGDAALAARLGAEIGATRAVLVERPGHGRSEHYLPAALDGGRPGEVRAVRIVAAGPGGLSAAELRDAA